MLIGVYTCQNATLLEIACHGSNGLHCVNMMRYATSVNADELAH